MNTHTKIFSIIDEKTADKNLFQDLYLPKFTVDEVPAEIKIYNTNYSFGRHNAFRPTCSVSAELYTSLTSCDWRGHGHSSNTSGTDSNSINFPAKTVIPINTRAGNIFNGGAWFSRMLPHLYNLDKLFLYNQEAHACLIEQGYVPLIVEKTKEFNVFTMGNASRLSFQEELQEFYDDANLWLQDATFVYWKKANHSWETSNKETKIYSFYTKEIYDQITVLNLNAEEKLDKINVAYNFADVRPQRMTNRAYRRNHKSNLDTDSKDYCLNNNLFGDISFLKTYAHEIASINEEGETVRTSEAFLPALVSKSSKSRFNVIKLPSWKAKSTDKTIEFASYTKNQYLKRQTSFAGIVYSYNSIDAELNPCEIDYFALVSNADPSDLENRSRSSERIAKFFEILLWQNGIRLWNPEGALEFLNEMTKGLNKYSSEHILALSEDLIEPLAKTANKTWRELNPTQNLSLSLVPKVSPAIKSKYTKLNLNFKTHTEVLGRYPFKWQELAEPAQRLTSLQEQVKAAALYLTAAIEKSCTQIGEIYNSARYIQSNRLIFKTIEEKYLTEYENSLKLKNLSSDKFFENLANDNIKIIKLAYFDIGRDKQFTLNQKSELQEFISYVKTVNTLNDFSITEVVFLIDRPVKIRVNAKDLDARAGGPYIVKVNKDNLHIKLAYNYSLFGIAPNGTDFCVHPHSTNFTELSRLFLWQRACLGEASPLIYSAFQKKDLKLILLAAMTWVSSANSTDVWGKKYDWLINYSQLNTVEEKSTIDPAKVEEAEIEAFLEAACEEEEEGFSEEPVAAPVQPVDPMPLLEQDRPVPFNAETDFTIEPETYTPYTQ